MRLVFFSMPMSILLFFLIWPVFQIGIGYLTSMIPYSKFNKDSFLYKTRRWEANGQIYKKYAKVHKWKKLLPEGGTFFGAGFSKKALHRNDASDASYLERFIQESCRAELTHWLAILPFWIFGFITGIVVIPFMFLYALVVNLPCIITQRYNRPRLKKLHTALLRDADGNYDKNKSRNK